MLIQARGRNVARLRGYGRTVVKAGTTAASQCGGRRERERERRRESRAGKKRRSASAFSISECAYSAT